MILQYHSPLGSLKKYFKRDSEKDRRIILYKWMERRQCDYIAFDLEVEPLGPDLATYLCFLTCPNPHFFFFSLGLIWPLASTLTGRWKRKKLWLRLSGLKTGLMCVWWGVCVGTHLVSRSLRNSMFRDSTKIRPVILYKKRSTPAPHRIRTEKAVIYFLI